VIARPATSLRVLAAALSVALLGGCDMCDEGDLRCDGHVVQSCNAQRNWEDDHDCGANTCAVGRDACQPWIDPGFGEVWCCLKP
jgi:hypothetical protein